MRFGLWLPVYGGWLRARGFDTAPLASQSIALAELAERNSYSLLYASENFLNCVHGPAHDVDDAWTLLAAVAARTQSIELIGALKPGFRPPLVAAQMTATVDRISNGRLAVNVVCGWWREEFERAGVAWLPHDDKYAYAGRYIAELETIWAGRGAGALRRRTARGTRPSIWVGTHSDAGIAFAVEHADVLFLNGMGLVEMRSMLRRVTAADQDRRPLKIAMNAFIIMGATLAEARDRRASLMAKARPELIAFYKQAFAEAGASSWAGLTDEELIDPNGGFATALVGDADAITARLMAYRQAGVDMVLCQFPDMLADAEQFGRTVIARLNQLPPMPAIREGAVA